MEGARDAFAFHQPRDHAGRDERIRSVLTDIVHLEHFDHDPVARDVHVRSVHRIPELLFLNARALRRADRGDPVAIRTFYHPRLLRLYDTGTDNISFGICRRALLRNIDHLRTISCRAIIERSSMPQARPSFFLLRY